MDVDSKPLNSQDNVEDCLMTGMEENVNCTCDCGGSSSKCVVVTADNIINQTFETSDAAYNLYVRYARCVGFGVRKGDTARGKDGTQHRRPFFCNKEGKRAEKYICNSKRKREHKALTRTGYEAMLAVGQHIYTVLYERNTENMECECSRWSSEGIPCSHMFCAMKRVGLQKFSESLLLRRWSKDAKKYLDESSVGSTVQDREREFLMRYGAFCQDKRCTKGKKEREKWRCTKCNNAGHVKKNCLVRNEDDNLGDKTGSGTQASFGAKELPKDPMASQGTQASFGTEKLLKDPMASQVTSAVPNTEVNASVQLGFGLGDSELINSHRVPIPPYGSNQWLLQVVQQGQYPKFNGM
ncbi:hypothetical protein Ahy_B03g063604 [Arachis hypogaea]|uniref:Protein FAR1-RELATED SEQUENCE n=1 Tax=Arachis hypogaea TaxID=3818 RepID=A0A444ZXU9_ARAHY|nr:hypothetical protein Ahy_B03g063604 [Arachis hypogaea]